MAAILAAWVTIESMTFMLCSYANSLAFSAAFCA
jgi:hypothetical protein